MSGIPMFDDCGRGRFREGAAQLRELRRALAAADALAEAVRGYALAQMTNETPKRQHALWCEVVTAHDAYREARAT